MACEKTGARKPEKQSTLYSTNRMEAAPKSQSTACCRIHFPLAGTLSILLALASGLALRLWMLKQFFNLEGDPLIYGDLAKNLLLHGSYALTGGGGVLFPSLIRLPGYPLFLALCFRLFGMENYVSAAWVQIALELAGCLLLADFAGRIAPVALRTGAAHCTLWLAALCPFTAVYAAEPLTEAPTLFAIALALWSAARFRERPGWSAALGFTFAVTLAALLRPDGALVAVALAPALLMGVGRGENAGLSSGAKAHSVFGGFMRGLKPPPPSVTTLAAPRTVRMVVVCVLLALMPFAAWSWRNWHVFHV